ncbi:hypothetical protein, partial [Paraburkholderia sabiae]
SSTAACRGAALAGTGGSKAAFFCLLFFAAAKKSRCRPAQGRRLKHGCEIADASAAKNQKTKKQKNQNERLASQTKQNKTKQLHLNNTSQRRRHTSHSAAHEKTLHNS